MGERACKAAVGKQNFFRYFPGELPLVRNESVTSNELLMARFQHDLDGKAFGRLVSFYTKPALALAGQILFDKVLAEDAVQEAFLRVVRNRDQYKPSQSFSGWFYAILRNVCIDMLRQRKRHVKAIEKISNWSVPAGNDTQSSLGFDVQEVLGCLSASEQSVLNLRIVHDMGFSEIAAALGISKEAAKKRAQRGLRALRERLENSRALAEKIDISNIRNKS
jgi:RNA polymerase sigma-70 factor (ECF subfamily)